MWVVCLDFEQYGEGLYQQVVQVEWTKEGEMYVISPMCEKRVKLHPLRVKQISPPCYPYGTVVAPRNHPERVGSIQGIGWHFKEARCFYSIEVRGKRQKKRYFDEDLLLQCTQD